MTDSPFRIVIVGGGTAGWLTATILRRAFGDNNPEVHITLVESKILGRIGVGEATLPSLRKTLRDLDIPEGKFFQRTDATFKHAIKFTDWRRPPGSEQPSYYHTFERFGGQQERFSSPYYAELVAALRGTGMDASAYWRRRHWAGEASPFAFETGVQAFLCEALRAPKTADAADYEGSTPYAYHTNAEAFADLLCELGILRGVRHLLAEVTGAELTPDGAISQVLTTQHGPIAGDFFVDCTGFASLLIEKALGAPFVSFGQHLLCDRAIALPVPHVPGDDGAPPVLRPFTSSTALESGWAWEIDLTSRRGTGYVYSSAHISDDDAEARLRSFVGAAAEGVTARRVPMRIGRRAEVWRKNCVAIGLSAGFLEPLESTGIYLIELAANWLADSLSPHGVQPPVRDRYNRAMTAQFEEIRDFLVLHYCLSERRDTPFWREVRKPEHIPAPLRERLAAWQAGPVSELDLPVSPRLFEKDSYEAILYGMGRTPTIATGAADIKPLADPALAFRMNRLASQKAMIELPPHEVLVEAMRSRPAYHQPPASGSGAPDRGPPPPSSVGARLIRQFHQRGAPAVAAWRDMRPGLTVLAPDDLAMRVRIAEGVCDPADAGLDEGQFKPDALVPKPGWRNPRPEEAALLQAPPTGKGFVAIVRPPAELVDRLRAAAYAGVSDDVIPDETAHSPGMAWMQAGARELAQLYGADLATMRVLGLDIHKAAPGTVTLDPSDDLKLGLHVDTWSRGLPEALHEAPNRICLNLGLETRYLLIVNLPFQQVHAMVSSWGPLNGPPTDYARIFMRRMPDYPVLRLEVGPGEAYIAPTDNLIHDGSNEGMTGLDVKFSVLGHFPPPQSSSRSRVSPAGASA